MSIPEAVVRAAIYPELDLPVPPPEHPFERVDREGYSMGVFRGATFGFVFVQTIASDDVERTLSETRAFFIERGIGRGGWMIPESVSPSGLAENLRARGLVPAEGPPFEPRLAAMAMVEPPPAGPGDVDARPVRITESVLGSANGRTERCRSRTDRAWGRESADMAEPVDRLLERL